MSLTAQWLFNEGTGTSTADNTGNGCTATLSAPSAWGVTSKFPHCLVFNGSMYATVPVSSYIQPTSAITISGWIHPTSTSSYMRILDCENLGFTNGFVVVIGANGASLASRIGGQITSLNCGSVPLNQDTHFAVTYDGSYIRTYINASLVDTTAKTGFISYSGCPSLYIGYSGSYPSSAPFIGGLKDFRIYNAALTNNQICGIYGAGFSTLLIADGDSQMAGYPGNGSATGLNTTYPYGTDFPSVLTKILPGTFGGYNVAVSSRELTTTTGDTHPTPPGSTQMLDYPTAVSPKITEAIANGVSNVFVLNWSEPNNMMYFSTLNGGAGGILVQNAAYQAIIDYAALVRADGAKLILGTILNRVITGSSNSNLLNDIHALNDRIRANWKTDNLCDALVDIAVDARLQNPADTSIYVDGAHMTTLGYQIVASWFAPIIAMARTE